MLCPVSLSHTSMRKRVFIRKRPEATRAFHPAAALHRGGQWNVPLGRPAHQGTSLRWQHSTRGFSCGFK